MPSGHRKLAEYTYTIISTYFLKACIVPFFSAGCSASASGSGSGSGSVCWVVVSPKWHSSPDLGANCMVMRGICCSSLAFEHEACAPSSNGKLSCEVASDWFSEKTVPVATVRIKKRTNHRPVVNFPFCIIFKMDTFFQTECFCCFMFYSRRQLLTQQKLGMLSCLRLKEAHNGFQHF